MIKEAYLILAFVLLLASYILLFLRTRNINPIFFVFIVFSICYLIIGELYRVPADIFPEHVYREGAELIFYCSTLIFSAVMVFARGKTKPNNLEILSNLNIIFLRLGYCALFCIGYVFLILNYNRFGGVIEFFNLGSRSERNFLMRETAGNYPFSTVIFCAFILAAVTEFFTLHNARIKSYFWFAFVCLLISPCILIHIVDGERSHLIKYIIGSFCLFFAYTPNRKYMSMRNLVILGSLLFLIAVLGSTRTVTNKILRGDFASASLSFNLMIKKFPRSIVPNEFATLAATSHYILDKSPPLLSGDSYKSALVHPIPRSFMKIEKPVPISDRLAKAWALELFNWNEECNLGTVLCAKEKERVLLKRKTFSTSISPLAEAIWNFGKIWACILYFITASFFLKLDSFLRSGSISAVGFAVGSSFLALAFHRSAFAGLFTFELYVSLFIWFPFVLAAVASKIFRKLS